MLKQIWRTLFSRNGTSRGARVGTSGKRLQFRPGVEGLEERAVPAASISGHVWLDQSGNGISASSPAMKGVVVKVFQDTNHNGALDSADLLVAGTASGTDGSYSFANLAPGNYFVTESAPGGYVRTAPVTASPYYAVSLADGQALTGQDFANFHKPNTSVVSNVSFTVNAPDGTHTTVTNLRGNTQQGDTVTVHFTVAAGAGPTVVSLVSYNAPGSSFDANTASQQTIDVVASKTFGPGHHSLTVPLPDNYYQVDFVLGDAITQLGPAGSNLFYSAQGRLLSADNGGTQPVVAANASLSGNVFIDNNGSKMPGPGNPGLSGVAVTLTTTDSQGNTVSQTVLTDGSGNYSFMGLLPGTYTVTVGATANFAPEGTGTTTVTVASGTQGTVNFGEIPNSGN